MRIIAIVLVAVLVGVGCKKDSDSDPSETTPRLAITAAGVLGPATSGGGRTVKGCVTNVSGRDLSHIHISYRLEFSGAHSENEILQADLPRLASGEEWCFETHATVESPTRIALFELSSED